MSIDTADKILNSANTLSLTAGINLFVSGDRTIVISNSDSLNATISYNPSHKRVEALLENKSGHKSEVRAFYSIKETGISIEENAEKFYTVDNRKNNSVGNLITSLTSKKTGTLLKCLTDNFPGKLTDEMYKLKEVIFENRSEITIRCLRLVLSSEIRKSKSSMTGDTIYSVAIPCKHIKKTISEFVCEKNGFTPFAVSASKNALSKLGNGDVDIVLNGKEGVANKLEISVPTVFGRYIVKTAFSSDGQLSKISVFKTLPNKEIFLVKFFDSEESFNKKESDFRFCTSYQNSKIKKNFKLFEARFSGKKYLLEKIVDSEGESFELKDLSNEKNVCTIRFSKNSGSEINIVQKESLYEARLDKVIEIGNTVEKIFE